MSKRQVSVDETAIIERARQVLPAGGFGNVTFDVVLSEGRGGHVWDESGNEYIDFLLGSGPMLVGHCHPDVTQAVQDQVAKGSTFFVNNAHGIDLAEAIVEAVPCAEKVRFVSTGSEATFYAMRVARAHTGRDKIIKFEGGFHGMSDYALMSMAPARPGNFPQATPDTAGIPAKVSDEILIAPFNDAETAVSLIREHKDELAGVIVEPLQRMIPPKAGFLQALRDATREHGVPLIFDEVVTGFRFAYGGAQEFYGVEPDLCALGKVIGGGYPLAAIAGRDKFMAVFDGAVAGPERTVKQIGTLSGNPVAAAAGLATLEVLRQPGAYETIFATGRALMEGLTASLAKHGIEGQVMGVPPMFDVVFKAGELTDYRATMGADMSMNKRFTAELLSRGILKGDNKFYVSLAHTDADVTQALAAFDEALGAIAADN
ncbi:MAG: aminotransferase class III-fold pyridoxal phosphate-dependent enzyme [Rhodospirillaceae bacterium]|nr:aminotransferase class III-fold pyridoxal phosphate-dependent enzyme [Rhodospirillaceae bacterium]